MTIALILLAVGAVVVGCAAPPRVTRMYKGRDEVVHLAEELLSMKEVREHASQAMQIVIETWETSDCDAARGLLKRAARVGDQRALPHLVKFAETRGCGKGGAADCYPCLRNDALLSDVLRIVQRRRAPH